MRVGPHDWISALLRRGRAIGAEVRPCEHTVSRQLSANQEESPTQSLTILLPRPQTPSFWNHVQKKMPIAKAPVYYNLL